MMNFQKQAWEEYMAEKGFPKHEWGMHMQKAMEYASKKAYGGMYSDSLVDNQDPVSDISEHSSDSYSGSEDIRSPSPAQSEHDLYKKTAETPPHNEKETVARLKATQEKHKLEEFANLDRLKSELEAKKKAHEEVVMSSRSTAQKRQKIQIGDDSIPVKKIVRYEKGKKVVKIIKRKKRSLDSEVSEIQDEVKEHEREKEYGGSHSKRGNLKNADYYCINI
jgi:hypothetical protein